MDPQRSLSQNKNPLYRIRPDIAKILIDEGIRLLQPIQYEAIKTGVFSDANLLICSPSGSGKTLVGELVCIHQALLGKKAFLLVPLRALANEKYLHLQNRYRHLPIQVSISTSDYSKETNDLAKTDIAVLTYERFDWLLRMNPPWLDQLGTIVIDEVHNLGLPHRGPRLESAIVRLRQKLSNVQIIALSATVANPEELANWLGCDLIHSLERPVELRYRVIVAPKPIQTVARLVRATLRQNGQTLIFTSSRREAENLSLVLTDVTKPLLQREDADQLAELSQLSNFNETVSSIRERLASRLKYGVAFHHAGLDISSRRTIEENYHKGLIKVICCTTTLSAGINTPARLVILLQPQILHQSTQRNADPTYIDTNCVHQILGRAGRLGQEAIGFAILLAMSTDEAKAICNQYFITEDEQLLPRFTRVRSRFDLLEVLKEQILVLASQEEGTTTDEILNFFQQTYWWFQNRDLYRKHPIEHMISIGDVNIETLLFNHIKQDPSISFEIENSLTTNVLENENLVEITALERDKIEGRVFNRAWFSCAYSDAGPVCSCQGLESNRELCTHLLQLALYTLKHYPQYAKEIIPRSLKEQFILDYLQKHGLIVLQKKQYVATSFGRLAVKLYVRPMTALWIRSRLPTIMTTSSFIDTVIQAMQFEGDSMVPSGLTRSLQIIAHNQTITLVEAAHLGKVEIGDLESLLQTVIWLGKSIISFANLEGKEEIALIGEPIVTSWETHHV